MAFGMSAGGMAHASSLHFFDPLKTGDDHAFDFSMLILFCSALIPTFIYWQLFGKRTTPWFADAWHLPKSRVIDRGIVVGSAIFGAGWALGGFCPGPSVAGMITGNRSFIAYSYGMYAFYVVYHFLKTRRGQRERHWGLTLALGAVPAVLYVIGPRVFPTDGAPRTIDWPVSLSVLGGLGIAVASILLFQCNGRVLGLCGLWRRILDLEIPASSRLPELLFFTAFMAGGAVAYLVSPAAFASPAHPTRNIVWVFVGGLLTGVGTTWANGCTSGHGIAGMSRLSPRSLVAVPTFMAGVFVFLPLFNHILGD